MIDNLIKLASLIFYMIAIVLLLTIAQRRLREHEEDRKYELDQRQKEKRENGDCYNSVIKRLIIVDFLPNPSKTMMQFSKMGYGFIVTSTAKMYINSICVDYDTSDYDSLDDDSKTILADIEFTSWIILYTAYHRMNSEYICDSKNFGINRDTGNYAAKDFAEYWTVDLINYINQNPQMSVTDIRAVMEKTQANILTDDIKQMTSRIRNKRSDCLNMLTNDAGAKHAQVSPTSNRNLAVILSSISNMVEFDLKKEVRNNEQRTIEHCEPRQVPDVQTQSDDTVSDKEANQISTDQTG